MALVDTAKAVGAWLDQRLGLGTPIAEVAAHPVPRSSASWWYVFGSATFVVFLLQVITGTCLALVYVPSANGAWQSLLYLNYAQPLGWYLRALHGWGSNFMLALMFAHMAQVFLFGAYKYPRELTWLAGVLLLFCTLGMAFTGQIMRFDQDAYWGLGIGASIAGRIPLLGPSVVHLLLGGPIIAGSAYRDGRTWPCRPAGAAGPHVAGLETPRPLEAVDASDLRGGSPRPLRRTAVHRLRQPLAVTRINAADFAVAAA